MSYEVYIICCDEGYLYTGLTGNLQKRLAEHKSGNCRLTKNRGEINLVYQESFQTRIDAARREKEIKGWSRSKKEKLINKNKFTLRSS